MASNPVTWDHHFFSGGETPDLTVGNDAGVICKLPGFFGGSKQYKFEVILRDIPDIMQENVWRERLLKT